MYRPVLTYVRLGFSQRLTEKIIDIKENMKSESFMEPHSHTVMTSDPLLSCHFSLIRWLRLISPEKKWTFVPFSEPSLIVYEIIWCRHGDMWRWDPFWFFFFFFAKFHHLRACIRLCCGLFLWMMTHKGVSRVSFTLTYTLQEENRY